MNSSAFVVNVNLYSKPGYAVTDFAPIVQGPTTPNLISVHPSVKANTLQEVIAFAKAAPVSYGSSGTGTTPHLDAELIFKALSKVDITHVPYGPAQAVTAVVGNQVPIASTSMPPAVPHVKANRVRPIAVTTAKRSAILPNVPTVAESGFAGGHATGDSQQTQYRNQSRDATARCERAARCAVAGIRAEHLCAICRSYQR
jgi:tripartite-type tricarboxylate transporter receptor subunit TctC